MNNRFGISHKTRTLTIGGKEMKLAMFQGNTYPVRMQQDGKNLFGGSFSNGIWTVDAKHVADIYALHDAAVLGQPISEGQQIALVELQNEGYLDAAQVAKVLEVNRFGAASNLIAEGRSLKKTAAFLQGHDVITEDTLPGDEATVEAQAARNLENFDGDNSNRGKRARAAA